MAVVEKNKEKVKKDVAPLVIVKRKLKTLARVVAHVCLVFFAAYGIRHLTGVMPQIVSDMFTVGGTLGLAFIAYLSD